MGVFFSELNQMELGPQFGDTKMINEHLICDECREASLRGMIEPLEHLATSDGPIFLYRCRKCGCLWEENLRESHPVTKDVAKERFNFT